MTEHSTLSEMVAELRQSQRDLLDSLKALDESALYRRPGENEWTAAENLVHIAEAREFFTGEIRKVLATPGEKMGRTITDQHRIQNVLEHGDDARDIILSKLVASHEQLMALLERMSEDDLQIVGTHVKYGPQTLAEFIEHFVVEHDQAHVRQIRALLA
jgi:uncharacterized damage-inducible protein DinB